MKNYRYLLSLFRFVVDNNPLLIVTAAISVVSVVLEICAMSILLPLTSLAAGAGIDANSLPIRGIAFFGVKATGIGLLLTFITLFSLRVVSQFCAQVLTAYLSRRVFLQLTTRAFSALMHNIPLKELEAKSIGYFVSLAGDESFRASTLTSVSLQFLTTSLLAILYFCAIVAYSTIVGVGTLAFLAIAFLALFQSFRLSHRLGGRQTDEAQATHAVFFDGFNGLRSVRSFSAEGYVCENYYRLSLRYVRTLALIDVVSLIARFAPALLLLGILAAVGMWPYARAQLSFGLPFLVTIMVLLMRFFPTVGQGLNLALRVISDARAGRDVTRVINEYEQTQKFKGPTLEIKGRINCVEANGVYFDHLPGKPILQNFSAALTRGKSYAIVGASGSGKSTVLDLLLGFLTPLNGAILIDGVSLAQIDPSDLRGKAVLVAQDTAIFNDTVANNLRLGFHAPQDDLERACQIACIHDFIGGLSNGYETLLNYKGSNFSGGQRQRIGIARAVLRKPEVLLLDESTSALDSVTREQVVENLLAEFKERILVFVTHDAFVTSKVDEVIDLSPVSIETSVPAIAANYGD